MAEQVTTTTTKTSLMDRIREFIKDVRLESAKVSWPTRNELRDSTIVVIVMVILVSIFVGVVDRILGSLIALLIH
jgi:preprotein translocase subunit SecE